MALSPEIADELVNNGWAAPFQGGLPRVPTRQTLPTASSAYAYRMVAVPGTPDIVYVCLRNAGGSWGWRTAATG